MEKSKKKDDQSPSLLREPKAKKTLGLKVPSIQMPHLELVKPDGRNNTNEEEILTLSSQARQPSNTTHTRQPRQSTHTRQAKDIEVDYQKDQTIAPNRDFQKVPNSHTKRAIPEGLFKPGKSKHLYDVLYSLTRGNIEPKRSIRISKTKLMKQAGIGSRITFDSIISHFEISGLIRVKVHSGEHEGNEFEVFTYDEVVSVPSVSSQSSQSSYGQKLDGVVSLESSQSSQSVNVDNKDTFAELKTFFKTLTFSSDDEKVIQSTFEKLNSGARSATGKNLTSRDWQAFEEIIDLILNETAVAKTRTKSVSIFLKFAAENLRRRLYSEPKSQKKSQEEKPIWNEVGKNQFGVDEYDEQGNYIPKLLDEKGREEALQILRDYQSWNAPIEDSKKFYTSEDWQWLIENLSAG